MSAATAPRRQFRPAKARFDPARAERQSGVTRLAIEMLGSAAAMSFLNADDAELGGRPIDLAGRSAEGLAQATRALSAVSRCIVGAP